jgi:Ca2+-binding RTX toxin-like protein
MDMVSFALTTGAFGQDEAGNAVTGLTYDFSEISYSVDLSGNDSIGFDLDGWLGAGLEVEGDLLFEVGLTGEVHVDLGHIDSTLDIGTDGFVVDGVPNQAVGLDTSGFTVDAYEVTPVGFDLAESYIELGFRAALSGTMTAVLNGYYDLGILGEGSFQTTLFEDLPLDIEFLQEIIPHTPFDIVGGLDGNIFRFELGDYVEVAVDVPVFEYEDPEYVANEDTGLDTIHITGESSPFLTLEIGIASFILPPGIGPIGFDLGEDLLGEDLAEYFNIAIEGGLFDAKLVGTVSIGQEITIESEVLAEVVTSLGETLTGSLGDEFMFTTPEGEGEITVTASYTLSQTVEAVTSLILNSQIDWRAFFFQFEATVDIGIYSDKYELAFALLEDTVDLGELLGLTASFELYNDITTYLSEAGEEEYTVGYENFVTAASGVILNLTTHQDDIRGGAIGNAITGNARDNDLRGLGGNDTINGGDGDDRLLGGRGADVLDGDGGNDIASYQGSRSGVTVNLMTGESTGGDAQGDTLTDIERVIGSAHGDSLVGNDGANTLWGLAGNDTLVGNGGSDTFFGGAGADSIDGGNGIDTLRFGSASTGVTVNLETGTGLRGDAEGDVYVGIERVRGTDFADDITGGVQDNLLVGGDGNDSIYGGDGNDTVAGGAGMDDLYGGDGTDTLDYRQAGASVAVDFLNNNTNEGPVAGDTFHGFEIVIGSRFDDILQGDFADNIMDGGRGADYMVGRDGADTFILHGNDTVYGGTNQYITDPEDDLIIIDGNASDYYIRSTSTYQVFEISRQVGDFTEVFQVGGVEHVQFNDGTQNLNWVRPSRSEMETAARSGR